MKTFTPSLVLLAGCLYIGKDDLAQRHDLDGDGIPGGEDCDDTAPSVGPPQTWYQDGDLDGVGGEEHTRACQQPEGTSATGGDCNDLDPAIHPGAPEVCNGVDDDCDGLPEGEDAEDAPTWFLDADGDGYGDPAAASVACGPPTVDHVSNSQDCDDANPEVHPVATEVWYDGVDGDCDGGSDYDQDGDGYEAAEYAGNDCDDVSEWVNPGATEYCGNDVDENCDGVPSQCALEGLVDVYSAGAILTGEFEGLAAVGDVNGDGYGDIGSSYPWFGDAPIEDGVVRITQGPVYGTQDVALISVSISGGRNYRRLGWFVEGAGDQEGDGFADVLVREEDAMSADLEFIYLYSGPIIDGQDPDDTTATLVGLDGECLGRVIGGTDPSGDGVPDVWLMMRKGTADYRIRLFEGPLEGEVSTGDFVAAIGESEGGFAYLGHLTSGGDVDGDGFEDLALIPSAGVTDAVHGVVLGFLGPFRGDMALADADFYREGTASEDFMETGMAFHTADIRGDLDGDGYGELVVGAHEAPDAYHGVVTVHPGGGLIGDVAGVVAGTIEGTDSLGGFVASNIDINGDSLADILTTESDRVYYEGICGVLVRTIPGPVEGAWGIEEVAVGTIYSATEPYFAHHASSAGDVDADGIDDILLGSFDETFLFYGGPSSKQAR